MALPKNKHLRRLTIDSTEYYWKVEDDTRDYRGLVVTVGMVTQPFKRFVFDFRFTYEKANDPLEEPKVFITEVTPKLIKESITFAQQNFNWGENPTCSFKFESNVFQKGANEKK